MDFSAEQLGPGAIPPTHNVDLAMQRYLLLFKQHEAFRSQLHEICPSYTASSTAVSSPSISPRRSFDNFASPKFSPLPSARNHHRCSQSSIRNHRCSQDSHLESRMEETPLEEMEASYHKLNDINEDMKVALVELLNCEEIRKSHDLRTWVQARLYETEKELRRGRRRRSSGSVD